MSPAPSQIVRWVALHILPQEQSVRTALRRKGIAECDADDLIQEAYCRLASLKSVDHIERPGAYLMQTVKNLRWERLRRLQVVEFSAITEHLSSSIVDDRAGPDRVVAARRQLQFVDELLQRLPERCRTIFRLRRIDGLSQREIAAELGVSENVVENDVQKALRMIQATLGERHQEIEDVNESRRAYPIRA